MSALGDHQTVGREPELTRLGGALDALHGGVSGAVAVECEPGIGKTRARARILIRSWIGVVTRHLSRTRRVHLQCIKPAVSRLFVQRGSLVCCRASVAPYSQA